MQYTGALKALKEVFKVESMCVSMYAPQMMNMTVQMPILHDLPALQSPAFQHICDRLPGRHIRKLLGKLQQINLILPWLLHVSVISMMITNLDTA